MAIEAKLPEGELPAPLQKRKELIVHLREMNISPREALISLLDELVMISRYRLNDLNRTDFINEDEEAPVIEYLCEFGIDPTSKQKIRDVRDDSLGLKNLIDRKDTP